MTQKWIARAHLTMPYEPWNYKTDVQGAWTTARPGRWCSQATHLLRIKS